MTGQTNNDQLTLLSEEERDALKDDEVDSLIPEVNEDGDEAGEDVQAVDKPAEAAKDVPEDEPAVTKRGEFTPTYQAAAVEDFDAKMAAFTTQKTELRNQFSEGEISIDEYEQAKDVIIANEYTLREQKIKADISAEQKNQFEEQLWIRNQEDFFDEEVNQIYKDPEKFNKFNTVLKVLGNEVENNNKKGTWFLKEADKIARAMLGVDKPETAPSKKPDLRKPDLSVVPKTLAHLPAADIVQTGDADEFSHLDRLEGLAYEKAVARLSTVERERFLKAA